MKHALSKKKGPAATAIAPDRGSHNLAKGSLNAMTHTTTAAETATETRTVGDASDLLTRAIIFAELIFQAGTGIYSNGLREDGEAIQLGADVLKDMLKDVRSIIDANLDDGRATI